MDTKRALAHFAAIAVLSAASGCMSTSDTAGAESFPTGKFRTGDTVAVFNPDGTYVGTTTSGEDWVKGNYTANGSEVTLEDTWEAASHVERMGTSCKGLEGRYSWTWAGDVLTANVIEDACEGRKQGISGKPWTRMP